MLKMNGGGTLGVKGATSITFLAEVLLVSPNISAAFLIKSSSESELSTLLPFSVVSLGGGVVMMRRLGLFGMLSGIVFVGMSVFWVRVLIFGSISGIVKSVVLDAPGNDVLSLLDP